MVSALGIFFSGPGQTYSISVFVGSFVEQFNGNDTLVSGIYSAATLLSGSLLFLVGRGVDRFGQQKMAIFAASLLGIACLWSSIVANPVMLFIAFFMLRFFGQGSMTLIPNTLVPQWFIKRRGRAMSFMAIGSFISAVTFPLLNTWLIRQFGSEHAWQILGVLVVVIFLPVAALFIKNKPKDIGVMPDNASNKPRNSSEAQLATEDSKEIDWTLKEAKKTRAFWLMLFCVAIPALVNTAITFHLFRIFEEHHLSVGMASFILSLMAFVGFPVTMIAGFILEKVPVHKVIGLSFIGTLIFLTLLLFMDSVVMAVIFGILWGLMNGFERITLNIVWPNYFGLKNLGSIKGLAQTVMVIGSALGPLPLAFAFEQFGSFNEAILLLMILPMLGAIAAFISPQPTKFN
ncbi:MFS transporter [Virgibacillus phasianinus]|uniref:MFS transporter n=2 Tax=Virgibacillus phasianinus TaxID=2017483 RepID=A0A220U8U0_9BACI|nr:MFS transporter [Virgibacillus phasianinus]